MRSLLIIATFFLSSTFHYDKVAANLNSQEKLYEVYKIDSIHSFYLIYCKKAGENFKIVSKKNSSPSVKYLKIREGGTYDFSLIIFPGVNTGNSLTNNTTVLINCYTLDKDTKICREEGIKGLYTTTDLIGLYVKK